MGGGLLQISAYGSQDVSLTGNPQISYFRSVYYRYTNFSIESIENTFNTEPGFGRKCEATINRTGDLINKIYLSVELPALDQTGLTNNNLANFAYNGWVNKLGHALIKNIELRIGGEVIDKFNSEWLEIWSSLTRKDKNQDAFNELIGEYQGGPGGGPDNSAVAITVRDNGLDTGTPLGLIKNGYGEPARNSGLTTKKLLIPLPFWFTKDYGSSLPLVALNHQDLKISVDFRPLNELLKTNDNSNTILDVNGNIPNITSCSFFIDYIYLDTNERKVFAEKEHEYIIDQLQYDGEQSIALNGRRFDSELSFSQPVKEIFWTVTREANLSVNRQSGNRLLDFGSCQSDGGTRPDIEFETASLKINGVNRFRARNALYFRTVQPLNYHSSVPMFYPKINEIQKEPKYIYCYSFALKPEESQPSGSLNFSTLDTATLSFTFPTTAVGQSMRLKVFALNYNILKINSGMAGLAYTN